MEEIIKYLEEIKEHQMQTVQLARSTKVYKLADKALIKALNIHSVVVPKNGGTLHHKTKVLTKEEVEANRSNAYKYLDL